MRVVFHMVTWKVQLWYCICRNQSKANSCFCHHPTSDWHVWRATSPGFFKAVPRLTLSWRYCPRAPQVPSWSRKTYFSRNVFWGFSFVQLNSILRGFLTDFSFSRFSAFPISFPLGGGEAKVAQPRAGLRLPRAALDPESLWIGNQNCASCADES